MNRLTNTLIVFFVTASCMVAGISPAVAVSQEKTISGVPAEMPIVEQLLTNPEKLHEQLRQNNPGYTGQVQFARDPVVGFIGDFSKAGVTDISALQGIPFAALDLKGQTVRDLAPLRGMPLRLLGLEDTKVTDLTPLQGMHIEKLYLNNTPVQDLKPLTGMPLRELMLVGTQVKDLGPLTGMPVQMLWLNETAVTDIAPLADCPLISLTLHRTKVSDLGPLARSSELNRLHIGETLVQDLTPLKDLSLQRLIFSPVSVQKGLDDMRKMQSLVVLGTTLEAMMPRDQFWPLYDKGGMK
jgi:internalin A